MATTPIDALEATTTGNSTGLDDGPGREALGTGTEGLDREAFLKLLVAQLKYQDPTKPADTSQMLTQTAQLTMVDRLNELTAAFDEATAVERLAIAGTIVGKEVVFTGPDGSLLTERADSVSVAGGSLVVHAGEYDVPYAAISAVNAPARPTTFPASASASPTTSTWPPSSAPVPAPAPTSPLPPSLPRP